MTESPPVPLCGSTRQKRLPPDCHIYDHEIRGECSEKGNLPPGSKRIRLQNERVDQRCTEEGLLVACDFFFFCQLKLPHCLKTGLLLLFNYRVWLCLHR